MSDDRPHYITASVNEAGLLLLLGIQPTDRMTDTRGRRFLVFPGTAKDEITKYNKCRDLAQSQLDETENPETRYAPRRSRQ